MTTIGPGARRQAIGTTVAPRGSASPRLDAELLLGHVLGLDRTARRGPPRRPAGRGHEASFEALVVRREAGEPVAYIRGVKEFYGVRAERRRAGAHPTARDRAARRAGHLAHARGHRGTSRASGCAAASACWTWAPAAAPSRSPWRARCGGLATARSCASPPATSRRPRSRWPSRTPSPRASPTSSTCASPTCSRRAIEIDEPPGVIVANLPYVASATLDALGPAIALRAAPRARRRPGRPGRHPAAAGRAAARAGAWRRRRCWRSAPTRQATATAAAAEALPGWPTTIHPDLAGLPRVMELERSPA